MKLKEKVSTKFKSRYKTYLYSVLHCLVLSWVLFSCLEMWLSCAILDVNTQNVTEDVSNGSLVEVSEVYSNGDFILEGSSDIHSSTDISEYIRVPNDVKYYYNTNTKQFVSKLTMVESRDIVLKFFILDAVYTVVLLASIGIWVFTKGSSLLRVISFSWFTVCVVFSQFAYEYAFDVLFSITKNMWLILAIKLLLLVVVIVIVKIQKRRKGILHSESSV